MYGDWIVDADSGAGSRIDQLFPRPYPRFKSEKIKFLRTPWDYLYHSGDRRGRRPLPPSPNAFAEKEERDLFESGSEPFMKPIARMSVAELTASAIYAIHARPRRRAFCPRVHREPDAFAEHLTHSETHDVYFVEGCIVCWQEEYAGILRANRPYRVIATTAECWGRLRGIIGAHGALCKMTPSPYFHRKFSGVAADRSRQQSRVKKLKSDILAMCERALCDLDGITPKERRARNLKRHLLEVNGFGRAPRASRYLRQGASERR